MKIVFFDMECTDLKALMGRLLCTSFKPFGGDPYTFRVDRKPWKSIDPIDDSRLAVAARDELEKHNLIVGWNSKMFDVPFLNARLAKANERPLQVLNFHADLMWYAGGCSMRIGSKRLENVQKFFNLDQEKTPLDWEEWQRAALGSKAAMQRVVEHCEADVTVLSQAYEHLLPHVKNLHR